MVVALGLRGGSFDQRTHDSPHFKSTEHHSKLQVTTARSQGPRPGSSPGTNTRVGTPYNPLPVPITTYPEKRPMADAVREKKHQTWEPSGSERMASPGPCDGDTAWPTNGHHGDSSDPPAWVQIETGTREGISFEPESPQRCRDVARSGLWTRGLSFQRRDGWSEFMSETQRVIIAAWPEMTPLEVHHAREALKHIITSFFSFMGPPTRASEAGKVAGSGHEVR